MIEPKLRFKADDGSQFPDWEKKKLEDVVDFLDGQRKPLEAGQRVSGKYPYYGASGIIDYVEDYIFDEELILLSEDGANILDRNYRVCFLAKGKYWVNNHAHVLRAMDGNVNGFICEQLETFDYRKYNSGGAQPKLNQATCRAIIMNMPSLPEQQKIADFLSTIDTVIEKQKETVSAWEERKKGVMQKLFGQKVRFKADDGSDFPEWEEKKLKNILKEYKEYSAKDGSYEHVSLTKEGVVPKSERYERDFLVKDVHKKYRITHLGDICYNPANLKFGVICRNKYGDGIFSPIYVTFKVCKDMLPEFVEMLVTRRDFIEYALKYQQGTVYERMSVSPDDLLSIKVMVPCMTEQQKIADCLVSFDEVIEKQKATLAAWEELKKGLLQQMFV